MPASVMRRGKQLDTPVTDDSTSLFMVLEKKRKRNKLPDCVVDGIREHFLEPDAADYVGFRNAEENNDDE